VRSPWAAALATFSAFLVCGAVPLLPYVSGLPTSFALSSVFTGLTFFGIGCLRSRWSTEAWWHAGLGTLAIGGGAATLAWIVGRLLRGLAETGGI
jgi:VIT1/CCC1 family predicted Fe2+/Mn2+ transporter